MAAKVSFPITNDDEANAFLVADPLALVLGMLLDQQVPMEWAFRAPYTLAQRLGERFDAAAIAAMDPEEVVAVFCEKPALHRFPAAMGRRAHAVCAHIVEHHKGDAANIWRRAKTGEELYARVGALPGFGEEKAKIFVALLAKRFGKQPPGWAEAIAPFGDDQPRSAADVSSRERFAEVRAWKKAQKAAKKSKAEFSLPGS
ncbi:MAG TPA: HhH-GPD-type base excision DNA repair protein [Aquihabitans sp.]|nr:HhH-GPD-type base excision DNA repair protein [Aquihabitans sp.]